MVKGFLAAGVPIDGVGLQMHISVDAFPSKADVSANMARLVALGLEVHITEMDVRCAPDAQGNICGADQPDENCCEEHRLQTCGCFDDSGDRQ